MVLERHIDIEGFGMPDRPLLRFALIDAATIDQYTVLSSRGRLSEGLLPATAAGKHHQCQLKNRLLMQQGTAENRCCAAILAGMRSERRILQLKSRR